MQKHGAIFFLEDVLSDLNKVVRRDANDEAIKGRVVEFAKGDSIVDGRDSIRIRIGDDVSCVE